MKAVSEGLDAGKEAVSTGGSTRTGAKGFSLSKLDPILSEMVFPIYREILNYGGANGQRIHICSMLNTSTRPELLPKSTIPLILLLTNPTSSLIYSDIFIIYIPILTITTTTPLLLSIFLFLILLVQDRFLIYREAFASSPRVSLRVEAN